MKRIIGILSIIILIASCGAKKEVSNGAHKRHKKDTVKRWTFNKILKSDNYDLKYKKATEYYLAEKYTKALDLYEQLAPYTKGLNNGEDVDYKYAMCNYKVGDYYTSAYLFNRFYNNYPNSRFAENALFMSAYCYYLSSPRWSLDQKETKKAIEQFQLFVKKFPNSLLIDSTNQLVDTMYYKLEKKEYRGAKLYYDTEHYYSATIALNNAIETYPGSVFNDDALFYSAKSLYIYANKSIKQKQEERYKNTISECLRYKATYPNGKHIKAIEKILANSEKKIKQFSK